MSCSGQDPRHRPTAAELGAHRLCAGVDAPSAQAALLPLIAASTDALAAASSALDQGGSAAREATGRFSFRPAAGALASSIADP